MSNEFNTRKRGDYVYLDFPKRDVSLIYNSATKKYNFYNINKPVVVPTKVKKCSTVKIAQYALGGTLGLILAVHLFLLISKI
jgi:hypothetical protein